MKVYQWGGSHYKIRKEDLDKVIEYFETHHENQTHIIAKYFGLSNAYTNALIEYYLSQKSNYYKGL